MSDYTPIITQAGINAAANAKDSGIHINISHIAVGTVGYTPTRDQAALHNERDRSQVVSVADAGPGQIHITAEFKSTSEYPVREVGFFLEDGTLFAAWSHPDNTLFYQTPLSTVIQGFDLVLSAVPVSAIDVTTTGDINMFYGAEFIAMCDAQTRMAAAQLKTNLREIKLNDRLMTLGV
ncbi:tail fiber protein [Pseudoalteromonas luteoviolacea]|nr:tail fiber protein [Pseudoalteromonas luteoviolacea]